MESINKDKKRRYLIFFWVAILILSLITFFSFKNLIKETSIANEFNRKHSIACDKTYANLDDYVNQLEKKIDAEAEFLSYGRENIFIITMAIEQIFNCAAYDSGRGKATVINMLLEELVMLKTYLQTGQHEKVEELRQMNIKYGNDHTPVNWELANIIILGKLDLIKLSLSYYRTHFIWPD